MGLRPASATSNGSPVPASTAPTLGNGNANGNGNGNGAGNGATADGDLASKQIFTTGEAAEICKISQQTIIRCFDSGRVHGFRVPGSKFRRIPREELIRFMRENGIPTDALEGARKRILVVDDDEQILELFVDVFNRDGRYDVRTAATGYEAGIATEQFKPDLILLDYMLPDINGNVVCQTIRSNPTFRNTRIIFVSGVVNQEEIYELLKSCPYYFLNNPFDIQKLLNRIGELVGA